MESQESAGQISQRRRQTALRRRSAGTKLQIVEAALETLKTKGFAGASAREIARTGGFNQALIFYHFGSVRNVLLAALDLVSERRMRATGRRSSDAGQCPSSRPRAHDLCRRPRAGLRHGARRDGRGRLSDGARRRGGRAHRALDRDGRAQAERAARRLAARVDRSRRAIWHSRSSRCTSASTCSATCRRPRPRGVAARPRRAYAPLAGASCHRSRGSPMSGRHGSRPRHRSVQLLGHAIAERLLDSGRA